jgi:hypothetical protein
MKKLKKNEQEAWKNSFINKASSKSFKKIASSN